MSSVFVVTAMQLEYAVNQFLLAFSHVPDEKLLWRPAENAKSAIELAAHIALVLERQMQIVLGNSLPPVSLAELLPQLSAKEKSYKERRAVVALLEAARDNALTNLKTIPEERLNVRVQFLDRELPMRAMLSVLVNHVWIHTGQLDYLQTLWGDMSARFL